MSNPASSAFHGDVCSCLTLPLVNFKGCLFMSNPASRAFQRDVCSCLTLPLVHFKGMSVHVLPCL